MQDLGLGVFEQQRKGNPDMDTEMHDGETSATSSTSDSSLRYDPDTTSDDSDAEDVHQLTINEHYAKAFEYRKEREELAKRVS